MHGKVWMVGFVPLRLCNTSVGCSGQSITTKRSWDGVDPTKPYAGNTKLDHGEVQVKDKVCAVTVTHRKLIEDVPQDKNVEVYSWGRINKG